MLYEVDSTSRDSGSMSVAHILIRIDLREGLADFMVLKKGTLEVVQPLNYEKGSLFFLFYKVPCIWPSHGRMQFAKQEEKLGLANQREQALMIE